MIHNSKVLISYQRSAVIFFLLTMLNLGVLSYNLVGFSNVNEKKSVIIRAGDRLINP